MILMPWIIIAILLQEKTLESPLDCKEIKSVNPNQPWIFIWRTDAEAEAPILWPPDAKSQLIRKEPDAGKHWKQEKGMTEDEMVGWHHRLTGHEFEQTLGDGEGQGSLVCRSLCDHKSKAWFSDWTTTNRNVRDFPDCPVAKTPHSQCKGPRFNPWSGYLIPHATTKSFRTRTKDPACCN